MADKINVKQINLQHCKGATSLISNHLNTMQTKKQNLIVLIQEPWINRNVIKGFDETKFDLFYNKGRNIKPRTCIVATKCLKATMMPQYSSGDITTIVVNIHNDSTNEELLFSSVYLPYEEQKYIPDVMTKDAINYSESTGIPIIIGADCNAHHSLWNSSNTNRRGELLVEYLTTTCLDIQNVGCEPTFANKIRQEVIDITLATQNLSNRIKNWVVSCEETLSDHKEINFQVECVVPPGSLYRNPRNTDWNIYNKMLKMKISKSKHLDQTDTIVELNTAVTRITKAMNKAYLCACPGRLSTPKRNNWWNNELEKLKLETRRLYRVAKASKGNSNENECWLALRKSRCLYTKEIRKAQSESWTNFCSSVDGINATSRLHKVLAKDTAKGPGILKKPDGSYTNDSSEAALLLLNTHFPGNTLVGNSDTQCTVSNHIEHSESQQRCINNIVNYNRVKWAINSFEKYKSPGLDNIYPVMLQKGWEILGEHIVNIYKACLKLSYVPDEWKKVKVVFIPKPGKEDYTSPKSFRPISLTSSLLKGLERLIDRHMKERMETTCNIHGSQHAFQQGKSTETALHEIVSLIEDTFANKEYLIATFMDIAGAFDNASFDAAIKSVVDHGFDITIARWIEYMLCNRSIIFEQKGHEMTVRATRGTPQGGVLSPTIWILIMDSLLKELNSKGFKATGYADDLTVVCRGKHLSTLSDRTQQAIKIVEKWCTATGLSVNPEKSEIVIFTKNRTLKDFTEPKIFGKEIKKQESAKYLGVILDSKLNWKKHIEYRIEKCLRIFWCCKAAIGRSWGLSPKCILWIYTAIAKPLLSYGAFLWWHGTSPTYTQNRLSHLQRVACLAITGAMNTTPQAALEALLNLPKLDIFIKAEAKNTAYRLRDCITNLQSITATHTKVIKELYDIKPTLQAPNDFIQTQYVFERNFEICIPEKVDWLTGREKIDYCSHAYFADGATSKHNTGYGALYARLHTVIKGHCGGDATIMQTEIAAIHACCIDAMERRLQGQICIYSDSINAITTLGNYEINSKLALECVRMLEQLAMTMKVKLLWIPSHSGFYGNETADRIAKYAAREYTLHAEPQIAMARSNARKTTDVWLANKIKSAWATTQRCEHTKSILQRADVRVTNQLLEMSKEDIRVVTGLFTGHCKLNSHLAKMRLREDPDCDLCGNCRETANHILCDCTRIASIRQQIFGKAIISPSEICKYPLRNVVSFYRTCSETYNHISNAF